MRQSTVSVKTKSFMVLLITLFLPMMGCSIERSLKLDARLPLPPAVQQMPLHVGVYYDPEFVDYTKKIELITCGPSGRRDKTGIFYTFPVGAASGDLFDQIIGSMFTTVTKASALSQPLRNTSSVDGMLELRIESFDWGTVCTKDYLSTGKFTASISYIINLYSSEGPLVASMRVEGLGTEKFKVCMVDCEDSLATKQAIKDAMAKFMIEFSEEPEVRKWLSAHKVAGGKP